MSIVPQNRGLAFRALFRDLVGKRNQTEFGRRLGYSQQAISKLLTGNMQPSVTMLRLLVWEFPTRRAEILDSIFPRR